MPALTGVILSSKGASQPFAFDSPPLAKPDPVHEQDTLKARIFIDKPLLYTPDIQQLVALCAIADTLVERVQKLPKSAPSFDVSILEQIEQLCKEIASTKHAQSTLQSFGLLAAFPYLAQAISGAGLSDVAVQRNPGVDYLTYISQLNQVVMMGTQLYHDACIPQHHKYTAHQIALLYQCLNMLQGDTKPIRRLIETHFEDIKGITESKNPYLPVELSSWLQDVTVLCHEEIKSCPGYIHRRLEPILKAAWKTH